MAGGRSCRCGGKELGCHGLWISAGFHRRDSGLDHLSPLREADFSQGAAKADKPSKRLLHGGRTKAGMLGYEAFP